MEQWSVDRTVPVAPSKGMYDASYVVKCSYADGAETAEVSVEFEAPSSVASGGYAEEVVRPFLKDEEPPRQLVIRCDGTVEIVGAAVERTSDEPARTRRRRGTELPQRARRRGRG